MLFATLSMAQEHRNTLNTTKSKKKECVTVAQASAPNA